MIVPGTRQPQSSKWELSTVSMDHGCVGTLHQEILVAYMSPLCPR